MLALYLKSFHIIGFVAWFAGLFYLVRLFVYHAESIEKGNNEAQLALRNQFTIMESRLQYIITIPAMIFTWICGLSLIYVYGAEWFIHNTWIHIKLFLLLILSAYTLYNNTFIKSLDSGRLMMKSTRFRLYNEVPTLFLAAIVFLAVLKNGLNIIYGFLGLLIFGLILMIASKLYKRRLKRKAKKSD